MRGVYELLAIALSRCVGLSGKDIRIYIDTMQSDNALQLVASLNSSAINTLMEHLINQTFGFVQLAAKVLIG